MIVPIGICPICNERLKLSYPQFGGDTHKYFCPMTAPNTTDSHYRVHCINGTYDQEIILPPYRLINKSTTQKSHIYDLASGKEIFASDFLRIDSAHKMTQRIKSLIIFS